MMYRGPFSTAFYRALHRVVHQEFRLRRLRGRAAAAARQTASLLYHAATLPWAAPAPGAAGPPPAPGHRPASRGAVAGAGGRPERAGFLRLDGPAPHPRLLPGRGRAGAAGHEAVPAAGPALHLVPPEGAGFSVGVFDSTFETFESFRAHLERERPSVVGLYCNLMTKRNVLRMAAECRRVGARVVVGGPEPAAEAEEYLARDADVIVIGEGEVTLASCCRCLLARPGRRDWSDVAGIVYRERVGPRGAHAPRARSSATWTRSPGPTARPIDIARLPERLARAPRVRLRLAADRARLPVHLPLVQPLGLRRDAPPALARPASPTRCSGSPSATVPDQLWYVDDVFTIHPGFVLRAARTRWSGASCASRSSASRAPTAWTRTPPTPWPAWAAGGCGSARRAARSACSTRWTAGSPSSRSSTRRVSCSRAASRSACSSCSATKARSRPTCEPPSTT